MNELEGFPQEVIAKMLYHQEKQGNKRDITIFERRCTRSKSNEGFNWNETEEGDDFWNEVINGQNFELFFKKYPKKDLEFVHGEYYWVKSNATRHEYVFQYDETSRNIIYCINKGLDLTSKQIVYSAVMHTDHLDSIRRATNEEIFQLEKSIENNKFFEPACIHSEPVKDSETPYKKFIDNLPKQIKDVIIFRQWQQGNEPDIKVFYQTIHKTKSTGGFNWNATVEGVEFWRKILDEKKPEHFFTKYPKEIPTSHYPPEIIELIKIRMKEQNRDYEELKEYLVNSLFVWEEKEINFWSDINEGKFHVFFEKYPNGIEAKKEELKIIDGEYYYNTKPIWDYGYIVKEGTAYIKTNLDSKENFFGRLSPFVQTDFNMTVRRATIDERMWLDECIKHNKYIPLEDMIEPKIKSIPEFVKIINNGKMFTNHSKAKEYGCVNYNSRKLLENGTICKVINYIEINKRVWGYAVNYEGFDYLIGEEGVEKISLVDDIDILLNEKPETRCEANYAMNLEGSKQVLSDDYIPGETYYTHINGNKDNFYIFNMPLNKSEWEKTKNTLHINVNVHHVSTKYNLFSKSELRFSYLWTNNIRLATPEEKEWLEICIKENRYVHKYELPKYMSKTKAPELCREETLEINPIYAHHIMPMTLICPKTALESFPVTTKFISENENIVKIPEMEKVEFKVNFINKLKK